MDDIVFRDDEDLDTMENEDDVEYYLALEGVDVDDLEDMDGGMAECKILQIMYDYGIL